MADDNAGGQTPPASDTDPGKPGGQTPPGATTSGQTPLASDDPSIKLSEARRLRKEAEDNARTIKELKSRLNQFEDLTKTDKQKRNDRLAELEAHSSTWEQERQSWKMEKAVLLAAPALGMKPQLAMKLIDLAEIKTDKNGEPTNIDEVLKQLIADYPELRSGGQQNGQPSAPERRPSPGATNPSRSQMNGHGELSWEYITNLTLTPQGREEFNARADEIHRWQIDPKNRIKPYG